MNHNSRGSLHDALSGFARRGNAGVLRYCDADKGEDKSPVDLASTQESTGCLVRCVRLRHRLDVSATRLSEQRGEAVHASH